MKLLLTIALTSLFCISCSNYPTSGGMDMKELKKYVNGDIVIDNSFGVVVELDGNIVDEFKKIRWHEVDLEQISQDKKHQPDLNVSYDGIDKIKEAIEEFRNFDQSVKTSISKSMTDWKEQLKTIQPRLNKSYQTAKSKYDTYYSYIKEPSERLDQINQQQADLEIQLSNISKSIAKDANDKIIEEELPIPKLDEKTFKFKYQELGWDQNVNISGVDCYSPYKTSPQYKRSRNRGLGSRNPGDPYVTSGEKTGFRTFGKQQYPQNKYAVYDLRSKNRTCLYIIRPIEHMIGTKYDGYFLDKVAMVKKVDENLKGIKKTRNSIEADLNNAHIIAKNKTGANFKKLSKELEKQQYLKDGFEWALSDQFSADNLYVNGKINPNLRSKSENINFAMRSYLKDNNDPAISNTLGRLFKMMIPNTFKIIEMESEAKRKYSSKLRKYLNPIKREIIKDYTVERNDFDDDCTFSGLNGKADYVVVVGKCQINGKTGAFRFLIDMTPENHKYKEMDELLFSLKDSYLGVTPKYFSSDNIDHLIMSTTESGLFEQLKGVRDSYKKQLTQAPN